ncbi:putative D,D-dipeptide transport system permease protein DdpB [Vibrio aerogenes CECT 7868]|uniref:Putative D,D-dipeptide transport system permease protein DdpB n=1 Tax=Vibrio aerogenes CECT 7868 TaxID=1216006 RepID=A0A1M5ZSH6_9VIBR|nr:ABC transporter permease [Vibrio aerogenes]SHI26873.1 putative D,D-dipeptide transport system permease protein DdpB [Vibrio aerogenes CECT 7868]
MTQHIQSSGAERRLWTNRFQHWLGGFLSFLLTLLGLLVFTFILSRSAPIDPALQLVGDHASEATYQQARHQLGLDQPLPVQFFSYFRQVLQGDLGVSQITQQPVLDDLMRTFPATVELATVAMFFGALSGILLASLAVYKPGSVLDHVARLISLLGYSVPVFWLGLLGLLLFYATLHWSAGPGRLDDIYTYTMEYDSGFVLLDAFRSGDPEIILNALGHLWLPVAVLALLSMASITRLLRVVMLEESNKEYVTLALAKGATRGRILFSHIFPNVLGTLITILALSYTSLLEGAVLTETVFAWPGLGRYLTSALFASDTPAVLGSTLLIGICFVTLNALADALTRWVDPRTR